MKSIPLDRRPDLVDMASPDYDLPSETPAEKKLIICSAPRTGSYELCRYLMAAGIGIPHEYFHQDFAPGLGARFGVEGDPLENVHLYLDALYKNRVQQGVFAVNVQYWQVRRFLLNPHGSALFKNAFVIHLFRPDIGNQVTSWRVSMNTGIWDYSGRRTSEPRPYPEDLAKRIAQYEEDIKYVASEDTGFRELFARASITPIFIEMNTLFAAAKDVVGVIANALRVRVNEPALDAMIARSKRYPRDNAAYARATDGLAEIMRKNAFGG